MKILEKIIRLGLYFSLLLPLGFTGWTRFPAHFGKTVLFQMLVEVLVILYLGFLVIPHLMRNPEKKIEPLDSRLRGNDNFWPLNAVDWAILLFLAVLVLTSFTGVNFANSFWGNQSRAQGVFTWLHFGAWYFLLRAVLFRHPERSVSGVEGSRKELHGDPSTSPSRGLGFAQDDHKDKVFRALIITNAVAFLVTLTALLQPWLKVGFILNHQTERLSGIFGNPSFLAAYLVLAATLAFYTASYLSLRAKRSNLVASGIATPPAAARNDYYPSLLVVLGLLELFTLYRTGTRGAFLGAAAGTLFFLALLLIKNVILRPRAEESQIRKTKRFFASLAMTKMLVLLVAAIFLFFISRVPSSKFQVSSLPATAQTRLMAWQIALKSFRDKPIFGWGPNNFEVPFNKYYNPSFLKYSFVETVWDKPHNWPLEILVGSGLLGLSAYLWLYFNLLRLLLRPACHPELERGIRHPFDKLRAGSERSKGSPGFFGPRPQNDILAAGLIGYFVQNLFLFETSNSLILFFLITAFISSSQERPVKLSLRTQPRQDEVIPATAGWPRSLRSLAMTIMALFLLLSLYKYNYLALKSSYYLLKSETAGFSRQDFNDWSIFIVKSLSVPYPWLAETVITAADDLNKLHKAELVRNKEDLRAAASLINQKFTELNQKYPDNALYAFWAGQVNLVLGERLDGPYFEEAEKFLFKARDISPTRQEIYFLLGRLYLIKKDFARALAVQEKAVSLDSTIGQSHWFMGLTKIAAGEREDGLTELAKAWELDPGLKTVVNVVYVIDVLAEEKKYGKVLELYEYLAEKEPDNPNWYVKLAAVHAVLGNKQEALKAVNQALILAPDIAPEAEKFIKEQRLREQNDDTKK